MTNKNDRESNFEIGDIVYYIGNEDTRLKKGVAYEVDDIQRMPQGDYIYVKLPWTVSPTRHDLRNAFHTSFISEYQYKKNKLKPKDEFKTGDIVYYNGTKIKGLNKNTPYKIDYYNPHTNSIMIDNIYVPDVDFISRDEYEYGKLNASYLKPEIDVKGIIGKEKNEVALKLQVLKDTKDDKLKWYRPYSSDANWFRTIIKLDKPKDAYLRFDIRINSGAKQWVMNLYYHRNKITQNSKVKAEDNNIFVRNFAETPVLKGIVETIRLKIDDGKKDDRFR